MKGRPNKYNARRTLLDGLWFDSEKESRRWSDLVLLQRAGEIKQLRRQVPYPLSVNGMLITKYKADFVYEEGGKLVVEDSKGIATSEFRLKAKLMKALYQIEVKIT